MLDLLVSVNVDVIKFDLIFNRKTLLRKMC